MLKTQSFTYGTTTLPSPNPTSNLRYPDWDAGTASADPTFDQSSCGTAVSNFTSADVLAGLQTNAGAGVEWVAGIGHPTFVWDDNNIPADYTAVDAAIARATALDSSLYTNYSAVEDSINSVDRAKSKAQQTEVDAMAKAIEDAIAALQYKDADYTKVDAAIAKANALKKDDYKDFSGVEAAVKAVVRGKNITEQSEVDKMAKAIEDAIAALEKKPASTKPGTSDKSPQTGDTSNLALWTALLFVSGGAAIGTTVVSRKKKYNR